MEATSVLARILAKEASLFSADPAVQKEAGAYMGWVDAADRVVAQLPLFEQFRDSLLPDGITDVAVLGMGGSSLSSLVWAGLGRSSGLRLHVLDSTHPDAVICLGQRLNLSNTLFLVASKSGTTVEPLAFEEYFWQRLNEELGAEASGHMAAITDPGSLMQSRAESRGYRRVFLGEPEVGGRFSAVTVFGLLPATLAGLDVRQFLQGVAQAKSPDSVQLGLDWAAEAERGNDKLILPTGPRMDGLGLWAEQLIAESTGKHGKGILPVAMEPAGADFGHGRLNVHLEAGDEAALGRSMYSLMLATAAAGAALGVNPFDQPDVQSAKLMTHAVLEKLKGTSDKPTFHHEPANGQYVAGKMSDSDFTGLRNWLAGGDKSGYVSIGAFVNETDEVLQKLQALRARLAKAASQVSTLGFGPRYLHSTGQYHKGGPSNGSHVILANEPAGDRAVPGLDVSFGQLCAAQAIGDAEALRAKGRRVAFIYLGKDVPGSIDRLVENLS